MHQTNVCLMYMSLSGKPNNNYSKWAMECAQYKPLNGDGNQCEDGG